MPNEESEPLPISENRTNSYETLPTFPRHAASPVTCALITATFSAVFGCSFQFGYNTSVINTPSDSIKKWINITVRPTTESTLTLYFSIVVSIWAIGGLIGALSAGFLADRFGRYRVMFFNNSSAILAAVLMGFSKPASLYFLLVLGRFVSGVNCGLNTVLPTMYLSEISPISLRGALGVAHQLFVVLGIVISQVLGMQSIFGNDQLWPYALAFTAVPAVVQPLLLLFCPESPRYLMSNNDSAGATKSLQWLRGSFYRSTELELIARELEAEKNAPTVETKSIFLSPDLRQPLTLTIVLHLAQQLSGINGIFYYSTYLFESLGFVTTDAVYVSIGTTVVMLASTLISVPLMDRAGRRMLMLLGLGLIICFESLLTITLNIQNAWSDAKYVSIVTVLATVAVFGIGPGSIPWFIGAELFPQGARAKAMAFGVAVNWIANFAVGISFEHLEMAAHGYCFLPFIVVSSLCWTFAFLRMPETKNRSFDEIHAIYVKRAELN